MLSAHYPGTTYEYWLGHVEAGNDELIATALAVADPESEEED